MIHPNIRIINIVDSVDMVNYGIWNAAVSTAKDLADKGISSELWAPVNSDIPNIDSCELVKIDSFSKSSLERYLRLRKLDPRFDIIATHGSWRYPTRWGSWLAEKGFNWIYTPQGMLESWAMNQKYVKKKIYYELFEKRMISKAKVIRAVSSPEYSRLKNKFRNTQVRLIPNGVKIPISIPHKPPIVRNYLFLSRLHKKKGIGHLVRGWIGSGLNNNKLCNLTIIGPDQGEMARLASLIKSSSNIVYLGPKYGNEKLFYLEESHFFVLPSYSEGFPTSVLEAMSCGLIPIITEGCNLPEAINEHIAINIDASDNSLTEQLNYTYNLNDEQKIKMSQNAYSFVSEKYSLRKVADSQLEIYNQLISLG